MKFIQIKERILEFDEILNRFQILYPENLCVLAGGCVRDHLLGVVPKDYDVFFLGLDWDKDSATKFKKKMNAAKMYYSIATSNLPWHKYERYLLLSIIWKMATQLEENKSVVQFMGFPKLTIEDLLKTFDWEICLFAYNDGVITTTRSAYKLIEDVRKYDKDDKDYKPPYMKLMNTQFPISNLRRGFKFENRYPIKLDYQSIISLCQSVLQEASKERS